jgi:basic amino acid/polyamine antiporter, APA family
VISGIGALNGWTLICGEVPQAAARHKLFPEMFAKENKHGVPAFATVSSIVLATIAVVMALGTSGGVEASRLIVLFSGVTVGVPYFFLALVQLYYLYTDGRKLNPATFPREVILAIIALVFTYWMLAGSGQLAAYLSLLLFSLGFVMISYLYIKTGRFAASRLDEAASGTSPAGEGPNL